MLRSFNLSGIGLGIYLLGLGIAYIIDLSSGWNALQFWLKLYPFLPILLGLDYILYSLKLTPTLFSKPDSLTTAIIIITTIVGFTINITPQLITKKLHKIPQFNFSHHAHFDFKTGTQQILKDSLKIPPGVTTVRIENQFGEVKVDTNTGDTISTIAQIKRNAPRWRKHGNESNPPEQKLIGEVKGESYVIRLQKPDLGKYYNNPNEVKISVNMPKGLSLEIYNNSGDVNVNTIDGNLNIEMANGMLKVQNVSRNLIVHNNFGSIQIGVVQGDVNIVTKAGQVKVTKINGATQVESSMGEVNLEECHGPVTANLNAGNLKVNLVKVTGAINLANKMGNIDLDLPSDSKFSIDANSTLGNIHSDFQVSLKQHMASSTATGEVNGGGPLIQVKTKAGNIDLHKIK